MKLMTAVVDCATEQRMCATLSPIKQPLLQLLEEELKNQCNISIIFVNKFFKKNCIFTIAPHKGDVVSIVGRIIFCW